MSVQYNFSSGEKKIKLDSDATKALLRLQVRIITYALTVQCLMYTVQAKTSVYKERQPVTYMVRAILPVSVCWTSTRR